MDELRKVQKVGYSTLIVSIPSSYARRVGLKAGDFILLKEEADGTIRLIPKTNQEQEAEIKVQLDSLDNNLTSRILQGCYALGFDRIEIVSRETVHKNVVDSCKETVKNLRGLEIVESGPKKVVIQCFIDPTKFPVDGLIKRLQLLVSQSLESVISSLENSKVDTVKLNEVRRISGEIEVLYWLIVRQLLVALNKRELSAEIGIESPLHAAGDRVVAKALVEIGNVVSEIAEELVNVRERRFEFQRDKAERLKDLAKEVSKVFDETVEAFLTPEINLIRVATSDCEKALELWKNINRFDNPEPSSVRILASYFVSIVRYCSIINEISLHRFLRKQSNISTIQI